MQRKCTGYIGKELTEKELVLTLSQELHTSVTLITVTRLWQGNSNLSSLYINFRVSAAKCDHTRD